MPYRSRTSTAARQPSLPLIWLLALTVLLLDLLASAAMRVLPLSIEMRFLLFGFVLSQTAIAVAWTVFGGWHLLVRLPLALGVVGMLAFPLAQSTIEIKHAQWLGILGVNAAGLLFVLMAFWMAGVRVRAAQQEYGGARWLLGNRIWQYSLGGLLVLMTSLSLVLALIRQMELPHQHRLLIVAHALAFSLIAVAALWAGLARGYIVARLTVVLVLCPAIGVGIALLENQTNSWMFVLTAVCQTLAICAVTHVVKTAGYDLDWRAREIPSTTDAANTL